MNNKTLLYIGVGIIISLFLFYNFYTPRVYMYDSVSKDKGKTIFILGSVHGNEPSGSKACYRLIDYLKGKPLKNKPAEMWRNNWVKAVDHWETKWKVAIKESFAGYPRIMFHVEHPQYMAMVGVRGIKCPTFASRR